MIILLFCINTTVSRWKVKRVFFFFPQVYYSINLLVILMEIDCLCGAWNYTVWKQQKEYKDSDKSRKLESYIFIWYITCLKPVADEE